MAGRSDELRGLVTPAEFASIRAAGAACSDVSTSSKADFTAKPRSPHARRCNGTPTPSTGTTLTEDIRLFGGDPPWQPEMETPC